jgi:serine protease Do
MRKIGFLLFGALLAGLIGGALASFWISSRTTPATSSPETPVVYLPLRQARSENPTDASFIEAAKRATPSVVFIRGYGERMAGEDFWSFWGLWLPRSQPIYSAGSGVVWSSDGYIVTNFHVVREAQRILVSFPDKRTLEAEFIGGMPVPTLPSSKSKLRALRLSPWAIPTP